MATTSKKAAPLGNMIDTLYQMRATRIEAQRKVDDMKMVEKTLAKDIMDRLRQDKAQKAGGSVATASIVKNTVPEVENWVKLYAHIKKTGEFELLHQRISFRAWAERYDADKKVPGVLPSIIEDLSLTKAQRSE